MKKHSPWSAPAAVQFALGIIVLVLASTPGAGLEHVCPAWKRHGRALMFT